MSTHLATMAQQDPAESLAEGLTQYVVQWAASGGAAAETLPVLAAAVRAATLALQDGHVCTQLAELARHFPDCSNADLAAQLLASGMVGASGADRVRPLILDGEGRIYLYRYFAFERRLAADLLQRAQRPSASWQPMLPQWLDEAFPRQASRSEPCADWQKIAAALACSSHLTVISGGPGTGKTSTVVGLLAGLLAADRKLRIALAAPTGKAAARMLEALRRRACALPRELQELLPREAQTLHRLLGVTAEAGRFRHHADHPLALDVLIVDEASMLDLALACRLCEALPPPARLILVGDKDQLAAVEAGAVFAEISSDPTLTPGRRAHLATLSATPLAQITPPLPTVSTPLADCVVWLQESYRFSATSGLGVLAGDINAGNGDAVCDRLAAGEDPALHWVPDDSLALTATSRALLVEGYSSYIDALRQDTTQRAVWRRNVFTAFERFRVLCALRETPRGVNAVNRTLDEALQTIIGDVRAPSSVYLGRPLIMLRNDYVLKVFNGDIGLCLPDDENNLMVWFPDDNEGFRAVPMTRLPEHETAWAMTVHKAQGSEFAAVAVLLPQRPQRIMTRELLYTAVTRASAQVTLLGSMETIRAACANPTRRHSGLITRLGEIATARC